MQVLGKRATKKGPSMEILWAWHKEKNYKKKTKKEKTPTTKTSHKRPLFIITKALRCCSLWITKQTGTVDLRRIKT